MWGRCVLWRGINVWDGLCAAVGCQCMGKMCSVNCRGNFNICTYIVHIFITKNILNINSSQ